LQSLVIAVLGIATGAVTFFVPGCSIILGCIVLNFVAPFLGYFVLLFWNICEVPGCDFTNLLYRWLRHKARGE
jgi:hypothetical protein